MQIFITKYREAKGLSMAELSRRSGVSVAQISDIEAGNKNPTITTLCKLSKALGVPCSELFSCE